MSAIELVLAFLEGVALIASPCILPVMPLVLATSVSGGRGRPYGVILGFVLSFSLFAFASRWLVGALGLDLEIVKDVSLGLLAAFGLVLLSERLSAQFNALAQGAADLGQRLAGGERKGFCGGLWVGSLIGLVWTPCAGPILAAVLVEVIRQESTSQSLILLLFFSVGAGLPMLLIALMGRSLMNHLSFFQRHAEGVRKTFGLLILAAVAFIASGVDAASLFSTRKEEPAMNAQLSEETGLIHGLSSPYAAPDLSGLGPWFNSEPLTLEDLKGKVVLIDFWTYSCINCVRTLPVITSWDAKYRDNGLVILGIHAPEFVFEQKPENVAQAIHQYGIKYPVALDNSFSTWRAFDNHYWPAHYLIDRSGQVVYVHFGEGEYERTEHNIRALLGLEAEKMATPAAAPYSLDQTPETYLGYARADRYGGNDTLTMEEDKVFTFPAFTPLHNWTLAGPWSVKDERLQAMGSGASLRLNFLSRKVYLVMGSQSDKPVRVTIRLNGTDPADKAGSDVKQGQLTIDHHALYTLLDMGKPQNGLLEIEAQDPGLELYAFTFGE